MSSNDVCWEFGDASWFNPFKSSGGISFTQAICQLKKLDDDDDDRPIKLKIPADDEDEAEFGQKAAIEHLKSCKKHRKQAKKEGLEVDDLVRWKDLDDKFEEAFGQKRPDIRHVVCLMLENRTFDGVQGHYMNERYESGEIARSKWDEDGQDLYSYSNAVEGPDGTSVDMPVWSLEADDPDMFSRENMSIPSGPAGPVEKFHFLNMCTYGVMRPTEDHLADGPNNGGFAQQYYLKEQANLPEDGSELAPGIAGTDFENLRSPPMYVYRKEQMPVLTDLMESFGCSDCHFSSAPCQTWPNRLFAACGTCYGYYNNIPYMKRDEDEGDDETLYFQSEKVDKLGSLRKMAGSYDTDTVFHRLEEKGATWGIYHGQASLAVITTKLKWELGDIDDNVGTLEEFAEDVADGSLPQFVWLEPNYDPTDPMANDMHPPANVLTGQKLIADIYNTLKSNENVWNHTLFLVTCDEGVGSFDHVKPPRAIDPEIGHDHEYVCQTDGAPSEMSSNPFTRFGTRVPNLIISPFINARTVVRPKGHDEGEAEYPFDHTSIIRTAFDLLLADPNEFLTKRDQAAPSFVYALESEIVNDGAKEIVCPAFDAATGKRSKHTCHAAGYFSDLMQSTTLKSGGNLAAFFGI